MCPWPRRPNRRMHEKSPFTSAPPRGNTSRGRGNTSRGASMWLHAIAWCGCGAWRSQRFIASRSLLIMPSPWPMGLVGGRASGSALFGLFPSRPDIPTPANVVVDPTLLTGRVCRVLAEPYTCTKVVKAVAQDFPRFRACAHTLTRHTARRRARAAPTRARYIYCYRGRAADNYGFILSMLVLRSISVKTGHCPRTHTPHPQPHSAATRTQ